MDLVLAGRRGPGRRLRRSTEPPADYLLFAERVLGLSAEVIANFNRIGLAESALAAPQAGFDDVEAYSDFVTKAAVLCWHLVKKHPLPDGNNAARSWLPSSL